MLATYGGYWSEWGLQESVNFDGATRTITVYPHVTELDIRRDVWSAAVRWLAILQRGNDRWPEPMERTGLDPVPGGETGDSYFLQNNWKLQVDFSKVKITGVLFSRDFDTAYFTPEGATQYAAQVSSIVNLVKIPVYPDAVDTTAPIWDSITGISNAYQNGSTINLSWGSASDLNKVSYKIYISKFAAGLFDVANVLDIVDGHFYTAVSDGSDVFIAGTNYYVGVRAVDEAGNETDNGNYAAVLFEEVVANSITPQEIWEYATRELTAGTGLTEAQLHTAFDNYTGKDSYKADVSNLSADVNVIEVAGVAIAGVDDFKADVSNLSADVNVVEVAGVAVAGVNDFKADVDNLAVNVVKVNSAAVTSIDEFKASVPTTAEITSDLLNTYVHEYAGNKTVGGAIHRTMYSESKLYVDIDAEVNGDGAQQNPFNVFNDAKDKAELEHIHKLVVAGDIIIPGNFKNFTVEGIGVPKIETNGQDLTDARFYQCQLQGDYTGSIILQEGILLSNTTVNGYFDKVVINGTINSLAGTYTLLENCVGGLQTTTVLDMSSTGSSTVKMTNYSGDFTLRNSIHADDRVVVSGTGGVATITSTCTAGTIILEGDIGIVDLGSGITIIDNTTTGMALANSNKLDALEIAIAAIPIDELTSEQHTHLMSLVNADFTTTNEKIDAVPTKTENADELLSRVI